MAGDNTGASWDWSDSSFYDHDLNLETADERRRRLEEEELARQMKALGEATSSTQTKSLTTEKEEEEEKEIKITPEEEKPFEKIDTDSLDWLEPSTKRKIAYGIAQEPTILSNVWTLGSAGIQSMFSEDSYSEIARKKEEVRQ